MRTAVSRREEGPRSTIGGHQIQNRKERDRWCDKNKMTTPKTGRHKGV
jgi:hypothetical protein